MNCQNCILGKTVSDYKSQYEHKKTIVCSHLSCQKHKQYEEVTMKKPLVYICSPFRGMVKQNLVRVSRYCRFASMCDAIPIAPHLYLTRFLDDDDDSERQLGLDMGLELLEYCSAMWVFGDRISSGMNTELDLARKLKIPVHFFDSCCQASSEEKMEPYVAHRS